MVGGHEIKVVAVAGVQGHDVVDRFAGWELQGPLIGQGHIRQEGQLRETHRSKGHAWLKQSSRFRIGKSIFFSQYGHSSNSEPTATQLLFEQDTLYYTKTLASLNSSRYTRQPSKMIRKWMSCQIHSARIFLSLISKCVYMFLKHIFGGPFVHVMCLILFRPAVIYLHAGLPATHDSKTGDMFSRTHKHTHTQGRIEKQTERIKTSCHTDSESPHFCNSSGPP